MIPQQCIEVIEPSQVGAARRAAAALAAQAGFGDDALGRLTLVVTELGTNLVRHARGGRLLLGAVDCDGAASVEVTALDDGPGMANVQRCLADGFSTGGTPGTGLGAIRRQSDDFSMYSREGHGTVVGLRVRGRREAGAMTAAAGVAVAGLCLPAPGETVSGDAWSARADRDGATVLLADGLGHGPEAAAAADAAVRCFEHAATEMPSQVLERAHAALRSTRGAAAAAARLDASRATLVFAGAGNIAGRLLSGSEDRSLLSQHGTLGLQTRRLQDVEYPWGPHSTLVLHSDGIVSRWDLGADIGLLQCDVQVIAGWIMARHRRGRDDATVVVLRRRAPR